MVAIVVVILFVVRPLTGFVIRLRHRGSTAASLQSLPSMVARAPIYTYNLQPSSGAVE